MWAAVSVELDRVGHLVSWKESGFLYERWVDVRHARIAGWHGMANWIKAVISLVGVCGFIVLLDTARTRRSRVSTTPVRPR